MLQIGFACAINTPDISHALAANSGSVFFAPAESLATNDKGKAVGQALQVNQDSPSGLLRSFRPGKIFRNRFFFVIRKSILFRCPVNCFSIVSRSACREFLFA